MNHFFKLFSFHSRLFLSPIYVNRSAFIGLNNHIICQDRLFSSLSENKKHIEDVKIQDYFDKLQSNNEFIPNEIEPYVKENIRILLKNRRELLHGLKELQELQNDESSDKDFKDSVNSECDAYKVKLNEVQSELFEFLLPIDEASEFNEAVVEVSPGVGGQEAMLFAKKIFEMYISYVDFKGWSYTLADKDLTDLGGLRFGSLLVEGENVFKWFQFETGVHRVQRIPVTEKSGRVHTSTATVAVLPQPKEIRVQINDKDLSIETKRASGAGGQHVNTTDSAVRITHLPSGIVVECQTGRSQIKNREVALKRLRAKLFEKQMDSQTARLKNMRKLQVGSPSRSDKIRTYNFNQDRITDHRLNQNFHNVEGFLEGNKYLDQLIEKLLELNQVKRINLFMESLEIKT